MSAPDASGTDHDGLTGYCRMLGHHLSFAYCRAVPGSGLCPRILDCWFERFDVAAFVAEHHQDEWAAQPAPPTSGAKVATLVELIDQARRRAG